MTDIKKTEDKQAAFSSKHEGGEHPTGGEHSHAMLKPKPSTPKRIVGTVIGVFVVILIITGVSVAISSSNIYKQAKSINSNFTRLAVHAGLGNKDGALSCSADIKKNVDTINAELNSPTWIFLSYWPFIGEMVTKAQDLSQAGSLACSEVLEPYIQAFPEDALIDIALSGKLLSSQTLQTLITPLSSCKDGLQHLSDSLNRIDDFSFMGTGAVYSTKVSSPVQSENATLQAAEEATETPATTEAAGITASSTETAANTTTAQAEAGLTEATHATEATSATTATSTAATASATTQATESEAEPAKTTTQTISLSVNDIFNCAKWAASTLSYIAQDSSTYADMLPELLGENGKRTYLLLAQQNSEVRSTGGFWGSAGIVTVKNGKIKLGKFVSGAHYADYPEPDKNIPETEEEKELFGSRICFIPADTNFIPDFPSAVKRYKEMWTNAGRQDVDGVIALDPVFLEDILSLTGGITTSKNIVVDGNNAAQLLEHDVYYKLSINEQDKFFAEVAKGAFDKLTSSMTSIDPLCACNVLRNSFDERRLQVWMKNENEEQLIEALGCSGALSKNETTQTLGVYFNNSSYSKLSWWLKSDTQILSSSKNADGSYNYQIKTVMANTLTKKEEQELPAYVASSNKTGACPNKGSMCVWTYLYAPYGGQIKNMRSDARICSQEIIDSEVVDGKVDGTMRRSTWNGFEVYYAPVQLEAGEVASFTYTVTTTVPLEKDASSAKLDKLEIDVTPLGQR